MRCTFFSTRPFEREPMQRANNADARNRGGEPHELVFLEAPLDEKTAALAEGCPAVCAFVNDSMREPTLRVLHDVGVRHIALRSAGFNHVDVDAAEKLEMVVARVPAYSPHAVAEHTVGLMLTANRKFHRAYHRVREHNFSIDGLLGFDIRGKTVGVVGTGEIGAVVCKILAQGFDARVVAYDIEPSDAVRELGVEYVDLDELYERSDVVTLHCPLTPETHHLIDAAALGKMKEGVMIVNTSRGAVIDTKAAINALKSRRIGSLALDVYEEEADLFFRDLSDQVITDDVFARLLTFPNVIMTAHQAFFTREALRGIAETTMANLTGFESGDVPERNLVTRALVR